MSLVCDSKYIVKLVDAFKHKSRFYIVLQYANAGDLTDYLSNVVNNCYMPEEAARLVFKKVAKAISHLHKLRIYHRDIKMMNVFVHKRTSGEFKFMLGDFGTSCILEHDEMMSDMQGTMLWMAPEVINKEPNGLKADIWSLGVLLHGLICGEPPFEGSSYVDLRQNFKNQELTFKHETWKTASIELVELVLSMLEKNQDKRFNITQVIEHPWISDPKAK